MKKSLIALIMLAGCGSSEQPSNNFSAAAGGVGAENRIVADLGLTGLYESGSVKQPNQLCIVDTDKGPAQFGLVVWGGNLHNCSGAGEAVRDGQRLRLTMAGDQACEIEATMKHGAITLSDTIPDGCSYYCGARARMDGATFMKKGGTVEDAMKAKDLVGEPLCAGLSENG
ncbi:hypothetical protein [Sphingosinicella rhizophila]|uniref:Lipoprotein n=1 Tax=Sphingosinicella rhizophila TaxID=3050082 RepID=A0ABU3Q3P0_9SPHN|nr:hypothetical protein [Sphingosinicella sp. GR2756]MDT9597887.1 hypothetical protein [Sphingosinicella sp. GR2756]